MENGDKLQKNMKKVWFLFGISIIGLLLKVAPASASILIRFPEPITARSVVVLDINTGKTLLEKNSQEVWPIASLTKLMTASVFLDTKPNFNKKVRIVQSDQAIGARIGLKPGSIIYVKDLFTSMLSVSANDAAKALARISGLTDKVFIQKMNAKAKVWGLENTVFVEPTGLDPQNKSTAQEYAILAKNVLKNPRISQATLVKTYTFKDLKTGRRHKITNKNKLLNSSLDMIGTKTGFIDESGPNIVAEAQQNNKKVIAVIFKADFGGNQFREALGLLKAALDEGLPYSMEEPVQESKLKAVRK